MDKCYKCGVEIKSNWNKCSNCNALLLCPQCDNPLNGNWKRCPDCSVELDFGRIRKIKALGFSVGLGIVFPLMYIIIGFIFYPAIEMFSFHYFTFSELFFSISSNNSNNISINPQWNNISTQTQLIYYKINKAIEKGEMENILREIVSATGTPSRKKEGALIAIQREIGLKRYIESGVGLNADLTSELLQSIFYPSAPMHDGGVIVDGTRVVAAACLFPLSDNAELERTLGTRHRAAIGLSENSDAVVIAVSEENGSISLAINGQLTRDLAPHDLLTILKGQLTSSR